MTTNIDRLVYETANQLHIDNLTPNSFGSFDKIHELIALVKHLPALYDSNHDDFRNRDLYWIAIASVLKCTAITCKNRFKYLRERYVKEKRIYEENDKGFPNGMWPHFEELSFLEPFVRFRMHRPLFDDTSQLPDDETGGFMSGHILLRKLIAAVRNNPILYDKSLSEHRNQQLKATTWNNIAKELNNNPHELQLRWKSIRDRAGKEKNEREQAERDGVPYTTRWCFEDDCNFLYKYIKPRRKRTYNSNSYDDAEMKIAEDLKSEEYPLNINNTTNSKLDPGDSESTIEAKDKYDEKYIKSNKTKIRRRSKRITKRENISEKSLEDSPQFVEASFDVNPIALSPKNSSLITTDEDEIFGQSVAAELRRVTNRRKKMKLKAAIFKMLCDASSDTDLPINTDDIWQEFY